VELTQARCTNCSADLSVDPAKDAAICDFCGSAFVVKNAIQSHNIANAQISAGVVNIIKEPASDFVIRGGTLLEYNGQEVDVTIPDTVFDIGAGVFADYAIHSITLPKDLEIIGNNAFCGCKRLKSIKFPYSLKSIGSFAFQDCTSLTGIDLPDSLVSIGDSAFSGCSGITKVHLPQNTTFTGWGAFWNCYNLEDVKSKYLQQFLATPWGNRIKNELESYMIGIINERVRKKRCIYCDGKINKKPEIMQGVMANICKSCGIGFPDYKAHTDQVKQQPLINAVCNAIAQPDTYHAPGHRAYAQMIIDHLAQRGLQW